MVAAGLFLDVLGFFLIMRHGGSLLIWAGRMDDLVPGTRSTPEELEEERRKNAAVFRRCRLVRLGVALVLAGFVCQFIGVVVGLLIS